MDKGGPPNCGRLPIAQCRRDRRPSFVEPVGACFAVQHLAAIEMGENANFGGRELEGPGYRASANRPMSLLDSLEEPNHHRDFSRCSVARGRMNRRALARTNWQAQYYESAAGGTPAGGTFSGRSLRQNIWTIGEAGIPKRTQRSSPALARGD